MSSGNQQFEPARCPQCRRLNLLGIKSCVWCQAPLPQFDAPVTPTRRPVNKVAPGVALALLIVLCLGAVAFKGLFNNGMEPQDTKTANVRPVPPASTITRRNVQTPHTGAKPLSAHAKPRAVASPDPRRQTIRVDSSGVRREADSPSGSPAPQYSTAPVTANPASRTYRVTYRVRGMSRDVLVNYTLPSMPGGPVSKHIALPWSTSFSASGGDSIGISGVNRNGTESEVTYEILVNGRVVLQSSQGDPLQMIMADSITNGPVANTNVADARSRGSNPPGPAWGVDPGNNYNDCAGLEMAKNNGTISDEFYARKYREYGCGTPTRR